MSLRFVVFLVFLVLAPRMVQQGAFTDCLNVTGVPESDCKALVALYNNTGGPNWVNNSGWLQTDTPCTWYGVMCDGGHVNSVELWQNNLTGSIPAAISNFSGILVFNFTDNKLTSLPASIGKLSTLRALLVNNNLLTSLPDSICQLSELTMLYAGNNQLTTLQDCVTNLSMLHSLDMSQNRLTRIPDQIGQLSSLGYVNLFSNRVSELPNSFGNLSNLMILDLRSNHLTTLPASFGNYPSLIQAFMSSNRFVTLPDLTVNMPSLFEIWLNNNSLTAVPSWISELPGLTNLRLGNNQLSGLPDSLSQLNNLQLLELSHNRLTDVPEWLSTKASLQSLYLAGNKLSTLPAWFTHDNLPALTTLHVNGNMLIIEDTNVGALLDALNPDWDLFQVVTPVDFHMEAYDASSGQVTFAWTPIPHRSYAGSYIIGCGSTAQTPFDRYVVSTFDKYDDHITIGGLMKGSYYCAIKTQNEYNELNFNQFTSPPSIPVPVEVTTPPTILNDTAQTAAAIDKTQYGYFLGEFSKATAEANKMPLPKNCNVTATLKSVFFEIPASGTRVPGHFVRGRVSFVSGGPKHFVRGSKQKTDTIMAIYRQTANGWRVVKCNDNYAVDGASRLDVNLNPAVNYRVVIWGKAGTTLKSLILQSTANNMINSGAETNTDPEPLLPDDWTTYTHDSSFNLTPASPAYSVIRCDDGLANSGQCYTRIRAAGWSILRIPVSTELAMSLNSGDRIRFSGFVRRLNLLGEFAFPPIEIYLVSSNGALYDSRLRLEEGNDPVYWKMVSNSVTVAGPADWMVLQIVTRDHFFDSNGQGYERLIDGTLMLDDVAVEVQRLDGGREWIPLPSAP